MTYGNCCEGYSGRRYFSREERTERLKEYQQALQSELKGVEERLKELEKSQ
jgi:hypothetical protein